MNNYKGIKLMPGIDSDLIRGHIDTIILNILAEGDRYGYEICKEVEIKSNGTYELKQPTLYSCLKRLEDKGLISSYWEDSDIGGKRHYYKLTDEGIKTYKQNQADWQRSKEIIDSLITTETEQQSPAPDIAETEESAAEKSEDPLIFEEIDKEVEEQDKGFASDDANSYISQESDEEKAEKEGFSVEEDSSLPFEDNDYSEYCAHLIKNEDTLEPSQLADEKTENSDEDDILALLGHYEEPQTKEINKEEPATEPEESNYNVNEELTNDVSEDSQNEISQEDAFLAKFITGKYSEYNPNKEEYLTSAPSETESEPEEETLGAVLNDKTEEELSSDDEEEFGISNLSIPTESYFDNNSASSNEEYTEPTLGYDNPINQEPEESENAEETTNESDNVVENNVQEDAPITYFGLNKNQYNDVRDAEDEDTSFEDFASKYDSPFIADDSDDVVLDFSKPDNEVDETNNEGYSPSFTVFDGTEDEEVESENNPIDEIENDDETDPGEIQSSLTQELDDANEDYSSVKPFENPGDTTSVYDKAHTVNNVAYTDVSAKEKLNGLTTISINPNIFDTALSASEDKTLLTPLSDEEPQKIEAPNTIDLSNLKETLSSEGINVKPYYKQIKEPESTKTFIETNKIKMIRNWIVFFIEAVLLGLTLIITSRFSFSENTFAGRYVYFLCGLLFFLAIAAYSTIRFWINPYKKVTAKYAPRLSHLFAILFTIQFFVIIYCINLQFGFFSFTQIDYNHLNWIVPCVVCLAPVISSLIYEVLYKSRNFHV